MTAPARALHTSRITSDAAAGRTVFTGVRADLLALAVYALLVVALHLPLVFGDSGMSDFDLIGYFYPYWQERAEALRAGTLPLWNTHLFTGVPFLGNIQTGIFYPLNLPLTPLDAPRAVAISYVAHVWIAATGMYLMLNRAMSIGRMGAFAGGLVFAFGGFMAAQAGHVNQVQPAAWLPALLGVFLTAYQRRSVWWTLVGGLVLSLQLTAGHPQETYLSLAAIGGLTVYEAFRCARAERDSAFNRRFAGREWYILRVLGWGAFGGVLLAGMGVVAAAMAAAQLLPSVELSGQGIRSGGLAYDAAVSFSLAPWELLRSLLPAYTEPPLTEFIVAPGLVALALGLAALLQRPWRRYTLYFLLLAFGGVIMAVGNFAFWYPWVYDLVPGVNLFRVPARWLFLTAFGAAGLAALGFDLLSSRLPSLASRSTPAAAAFATCVALAAAALAIIPAWLYGSLGLLHIPPPEVVLRWFAFGVPAGLLAVYGALVWRRPQVAGALLVLLVVELALAREPMPVSHPLPSSVFRTIRPGLSQFAQDTSQYRVLSLANPAFEPGDIKELRALYGERLSPADVRFVIETLKYQDVLAPNVGMQYNIDTFDAYDGGLLPTKDFAAIKRLILDRSGRIPGRNERASEAKEAGILVRDGAPTLPDAALLGALNVKYGVADRLTDVWVDGAYHDLAFTRTLKAGERFAAPLEIDRVLPDGATGLSLATFLEGATTLPQGTVAGTVTVTDAEGRVDTYPLRAGQETAESDTAALEGAAHQAARGVIDRRWLPGHRVYAAKIDFGRVAYPRSVVVEAALPAGALSLAGLAVLDSRSNGDYSPSLDPDWPRVYTGDTKIYQNRRFQPRAAVPATVQRVATADEQLAALPGLPADGVVLTEESETAAGAQAQGDPAAGNRVQGSVTVRSYQPERVQLEAKLDRPGYVLLRDSYYPGWHVSVDGVETTVLRADYLFRAVAVPAGTHAVQFWYEPPSLRMGLVISVWATGAVLAVLALWPAIRWVIEVRRTYPKDAPPVP